MSEGISLNGITSDKSDSNSGLVYLLKDRAPRVAMTLAGATAAKPLAQKAWSLARERTTYTITVKGDDAIYDDLHEWVLSLLPDSRRRSLYGYSERSPRSGTLVFARDEGDSPTPTPVPKMRFRYNGTRTQTIRLGNHRFQVSVSEGDLARDGAAVFMMKPPEMAFVAHSAAARDALHEHMDQLLAHRHAQKKIPALRVGTSWGDWDKVDDLSPRTLESVFLDDGQLERLIDDLGQFLRSEADYIRRCTPYHRGYLFQGPPGTGKTSAARALAHHFNMDIWYLPLSDVPRDTTLMRMVGRVQPKSVLLLEDIDVFHAATQRDDDSEVTLSGLLNTLDGIVTPHGLITIMTTNNPEALDPAIVRPGRVDVTEDFTLADPKRVARMLRWFYPEDGSTRLWWHDGSERWVPSEVLGVMQEHWDDPGAALKALSP